jgi:hypothetical protein
MNPRARARRGGFTQVTDATDPVPGLTPCHTPPAGWRFCRLVVSRVALFEAIPRERLHEVVRHGGPPVPGFDPGHPTRHLKLIEAVYELHRVLAIHYRGSEG